MLSTPMYDIGVGFGAAGGAPSIDTFAIFGAGAKTINFALAGQRMVGGTQLLPAAAGRAGGGQDDVTARCSAATVAGGGCALNATSTLVLLAGLELAAAAAGGGAATVAATESWALRRLNDSAFSFEVRRVWAAGAVALSVDRVSIALRTTGGLPIHSEQIPGFVDLDLFLNETSTGGFALGNGAFEFLSPHARQFVRFTPTGALFVVDASATLGGTSVPPLFSFAKPFADGTADCSIGYQLIDPRAGPRAAPAPGTEQVVTVTFNLVETDIPAGAGAPGGLGPFPRMDVALANATLQQQMETLLGAQYQLLGWLMGNNPASVPCLHEMAWWPMMSSVFPAASGVAVRAMQRELSFFAKCGWAPYAWSGGAYEYVHSCSLADGASFGLTQRYASSGFYQCPWGPLTDQDVMLPIAVYYAATSSGDMAWLASMRPALDAVAAFLAQSGLALGGTGPAVFVSPASGLADGGRHAGNWYDVVLFGHLDAYLAVHGVWAMSCLAEIYAALGDAAAAAHAAAVHAQAVADFNAVFYNDTLRQYHDWIDTAGNKRTYFYVDIAFVAILAGVAGPARTDALLDHFDARLAEIYSSLNVTPGSIWSAPSNLYPITDGLEFADGHVHAASGGAVPFPSYENGGAFFHTPGLQFAALGSAGRADAALSGFVTLMSSGFGAIRGWAQQLYWAQNGGAGSLVGGDPLNTAALSIWGFMRGAFGAAPTLTRGVVATNAPAAALEGSRWNVSHLGRDVCLLVGRGTTTFCNGSSLAPGAP